MFRTFRKHNLGRTALNGQRKTKQEEDAKRKDSFCVFFCAEKRREESGWVKQEQSRIKIRKEQENNNKNEGGKSWYR